MNSITLTAIARPPETDQGNLFVRLTPRTAWRLASMIHSNEEESLLSEECVVEFLPLEIMFELHHKHHQINKGDEILSDDDGIVTVYASYNGGAPAPFVCSSTVNHYGGHDEDVIELPLDLHPSLASEFNTTSEPIKVSVRPLPNVPVAEQVIFEPLSTSDWELIEMEASVLEDGGLLNQITIVYPGQVFPLRLVSPGESYSGGLESAAWIRVVAEDGFDSDETDSIFASDSDSSQSELCGVNYNCLRLMAETEVSVIPKPRLKNDDENEPSVERDSTRSNDPVYAHSCPLRVQFTSPSDHETTTTSMPPISLLGCAYVHSYTLKHLPGYQQMFETELACLENVSDLPSAVVSLSKWDDKKCTEESECALARINASDSVREGHITMHECLRIQIGATPLTNCVCVQILPHSHLIDSLARSREDIAQGRKTIKLESVSLKELDFTDIISDSTKDEETASAIQTSTLISSGFIIPVATLRSLLPERKNWSNQCCLFSLKFESTTGDKSVRAASRLGSVITGDDLKRLLEKNGQNECITSGARSQTQSTPTASTKATAIHTAPVDMYVEGFSSTIERLIQDISKIISFPRICGATAHRNAILLTGERGCGKTHLALTLASRSLRLNSIGMVYLDCKKLQTTPGSTTSSILKEIQSSFEQALRKQPSLLILDDLDAVIPNCENSDGGDGSIHHQQTNPALVSQVKAVADHLVRYTCQCGYSNVVLLCTCRDDDSLAARYKNSGIFYSSVEVPSLNFHQRTKFLHHCVLGKRSEVEPSFHDIPHCILKLGKMTDGFRPHDLKLLTARIRNAQYLRQIDHSSQEKTFVGDIAMESGKVSLEMLEKDVASAIEEFTPLSQQSVDITQNKCTVDWSSVGGLKHAKQSLYDVIIHPMNFKAIYDNLPTSLPTGVLLYGFPGCGKSFIVPTLAKASNLSLISCRGPELLDRYIGASEAKVRQLFAQAVEAAPSLIFFDDFDSLAPQRGSDHTGVTDRVVNQLLTLLDGAERNTKTSQIYIVAATSRPDKIDSALLRPGRLETHVYVGYPESLLEWEELFSSILSSWNVDEEVSLLRQKKELCSVLCKDLSYVKDLSAADMIAVMDTAHLMRVHEMLDDEDDCESPQNETPPGVIICKSHIIEAFKRTRPSLLPEDRQKLQRYYQPFRAEEKYTSDQDTANALKTSFR